MLSWMSVSAAIDYLWLNWQVYVYLQSITSALMFFNNVFKSVFLSTVLVWFVGYVMFSWHYFVLCTHLDDMSYMLRVMYTEYRNTEYFNWKIIQIRKINYKIQVVICYQCHDICRILRLD